MPDLSVTAVRGRWVLACDEAGELAAFASQAEALAAAGAWGARDAEARTVLVSETCGEWEEAVIEALALH